MNKIIDIQNNHTYSDYRRFFGYEYDKGKLLGFTKDQYEYMNPDRQYWELKDENGVTKYFELPKYVKPFTYFSPYSFNRVRHSRPARNALYILGGLVIASITCSFVAQKFFGTHNFDENVPLESLNECAEAYYKWKDNGGDPKDPSKDDITNDIKSVATLANMAMGNFLYETVSDPGHATLRENIATVAHGHSDTNIIISHVLVDISNTFQQIDGKQMEESLSFGTMSLTRFAKRDYFDASEDLVTAYHGTPTSSTEAKWGTLDNKYSEKQYTNLVGKNPAQPFLYNITKDTVLTKEVYDEDYDTGEKHFGNSSCVAIKENNIIKGYKIELDLHNIKSVTRYVKRMTYLSGQTPNRFNTIHMSLETDANLILKKSYVKENYIVTMMQSNGWLDTRYYIGEEETQLNQITPNNEAFDYSKYKF